MISGIVALVLAALLFYYHDIEIGSGFVQLGLCVTVFALLPTARNVRRVLSLKSEKQIEEHFQRSLAFFFTSMISICFVIFQAIGCLSGGDDVSIVKTCEADTMSSFTIGFSLLFLFIYEVFFGFFDVDVSMESTCTLLGTNFLTFARTFVYGVSSSMAFMMYGMKQFVFTSMGSATGNEEMNNLLLNFASYSQNLMIFFVGLSICFETWPSLF